jgi:outer membrane protein OmpA-like peptidoglycan-associated protein
MQTMLNTTNGLSMQSFTKLTACLLASWLLAGCSTTKTGCLFGFGKEEDKNEAITVTVYLRPVVANLDYKDIYGSRNQVIVQGGFQHVLSVDSQATAEHALSPVGSLGFTGKLIRDTETIGFEFDRSTITKSERAKLDRLVSRIESGGLLHVDVEGHTDANGSARYNQMLSVKRATAVKDYLVGHGIAHAKIAIKGYGETKPIVPNNTERDKAINRRATVDPTLWGDH